ncbi:Uncharacterised protein [Vibrio cholerae]|nr:Uncharacterised protein [Vibrio cholerae]CSI50789.1 Uncharacterised protein [Vibrio cholerae]
MWSESVDHGERTSTYWIFVSEGGWIFHVFPHVLSNDRDQRNFIRYV